MIVEITKRPQGEAAAHGRVVEVLEDLRPSDLAARFAILRHDLPQEFPPDVLHAANLFAPDVLPADSAGPRGPARPAVGNHRRRGRQGFRRCGIRRTGARRRMAARGGHCRCQPLRAPSAAQLDAEARSRATSVYFPDRVIPMLPEHLSNHLCSLMPHVERLAFVCDMRVSKAGKLGKSRFLRGGDSLACTAHLRSGLGASSTTGPSRRSPMT